MKRISEVIKELESLKEQHGDLPVVYADHENGFTSIPDWDPTFEVSRVHDNTIGSDNAIGEIVEAIKISC